MLEAVKAELEMVKQIIGKKNMEIEARSEMNSTLETEIKDLKTRLEVTLITH
jgi:predicted  nucleic acid-binding Zn-ribbon protein